LTRARTFHLAFLCCLTLVACQAPSLGGPGEGSASPADVPSNASPEETDMSPGGGELDADAAKLVALATEDLADMLEMSPERIELVRVEATEWRDGSLGCPKPNVDYIQRVTPGYAIWLQAGEDVYEYHSDDTTRIVRCDTP
jgi:hypothetical protein